MARGWAISVLACAGCRGVLGFDDLADEAEIHFHLTRSNLENDADGLPITATQPPSLDGVDVRLADGSEVGLALDAGGAIVFRTPIGERYKILLAAAEGNLELQTAAKEPVYDDLTFGRADAEPTLPNTRLQYAMVPDGAFLVGTSGGMTTDFGMVDSIAQTVTFDWTRARPFIGAAPALVSSSANDRVHLLQFGTQVVSGVQLNHIIQAQTDELDLVGGGVVSINAHLAPVVDRSISISADTPAVRSSCNAVGYKEATLDAQAILAVATPTFARADRGFLLDFASPGLVEAPLAFAMPIPDQVYPYPTTVLLDLAFNRKADTAVGTESLSCHLQSFTELPAGATSIALEQDIGFATSILIDGFPLADDIAIPISDRPLTARWTTRGAAELFVVILRDLDTDDDIRVYVSDAPEVTIEPSVVEIGHHYTMEIISRHGSADFTAITRPFIQSTVSSPVFRPVGP